MKAPPDQLTLAILVAPALLLYVLELFGIGSWLPVLIVLAVAFLVALALNTLFPWSGTTVYVLFLAYWTWKAYRGGHKKTK